MKAKIAEVFESIQGEGIYAGTKQIFVRFYGCNLACKFCDTRLTQFDKYSSLELDNLLQKFPKSVNSICFTGGEPLRQKDFLKEILGIVKHRGYKTYLETNGTLFNELKEVLDDVDTISMDFKLPSSTGLKSFWDEHKKFLGLASRKDVFVKTVICHSTKKDDLDRAIGLLRSMDLDIPLVLQPNFFETDNSLLRKISEFQEMALNRLKDVRVIPQIHKYIARR
ncbi:MAG: 7-carboxy-7-deazaguanine synthase QueE [Candidatus Omnitrophota bacterium]